MRLENNPFVCISCDFIQRFLSVHTKVPRCDWTYECWHKKHKIGSNVSETSKDAPIPNPPTSVQGYNKMTLTNMSAYSKERVIPAYSGNAQLLQLHAMQQLVQEANQTRAVVLDFVKLYWQLGSVSIPLLKVIRHWVEPWKLSHLQLLQRSSQLDVIQALQ